MSASTSSGNPFKDPSLSGSKHDVTTNPESSTTLAVSRHVSLTLSSDSLVILDDSEPESSLSNCCGVLPSGHQSQAIRYYNILWAEQQGEDLIIRYAKPVSKNAVRVAYLNYRLEKVDQAPINLWVESLLRKAYGHSQRQKRIKVLINPFGGVRTAQKLYGRDIEPIFAAARCHIDVEHTQYSGHAIKMAEEEIDPDAWDVIACCSGDGIPHEVWNGLGKRPDAARALHKVAVVQLPCGSGNGLCLSLTKTNSPSLAALAVIKGVRTPIDLMSVTQGDRRTLSFLTQSLGIVAESDVGTEHLRWMGDLRFTYGIVSRVIQKATYPLDIAVHVEDDNKDSIRQKYRNAVNLASEEMPPDTSTPPEGGLPPLTFGTVNDPLPESFTPLTSYPTLGTLYAGNVPITTADAYFFPAALPNDGCIDLITIDGTTPFFSYIGLMQKVEKGVDFFDDEIVSYRKIKAYRAIPKMTEGHVSVDGEPILYEPWQVECHQGLGMTLSRTGWVYENDGV